MPLIFYHPTGTSRIITTRDRILLRNSLSTSRLLLNINFLGILRMNFYFIHRNLCPPYILFSMKLFPSLKLCVAIATQA